MLAALIMTMHTLTSSLLDSAKFRKVIKVMT